MNMKILFGSPPLFPSHPLTRTRHLYSSSRSEPPTPPSQPPPVPPEPLRITSDDQQQPVSATKQQQPKAATNPKTTSVDSTDWIASSLTRRFGLGAGLAWAGFLAFGVISEQIKTRLEVSSQEANTRDVEKQEEIVLPNGIRYTELRVGGGASPRTGDLIVVNLKGQVEETGEVFVDTFNGETNKPKALALVMGSRPYSKGMCEGLEYVLRSMKAGGKRRVIVPPNHGFGEEGPVFGFYTTTTRSTGFGPVSSEKASAEELNKKDTTTTREDGKMMISEEYTVLYALKALKNPLRMLF
ncbi:hypothetical protein ACFE04_010988 [Oxalis oulophora]